jgi:hypothetical protein
VAARWRDGYRQCGGFKMSPKSIRSTKRAKPDDVTLVDLYNFMTGSDDFAEARSVIRSIIDDDPIDLIRLESGLRDALAAIRKIRSSTMSTKKIQELMSGREEHYASLLRLIVGRQH